MSELIADLFVSLDAYASAVNVGPCFGHGGRSSISGSRPNWTNRKSSSSDGWPTKRSRASPPTDPIRVSASGRIQLSTDGHQACRVRDPLHTRGRARTHRSERS
jgi:hypothetical protein